jgi:hypothetical protein
VLRLSILIVLACACGCASEPSSPAPPARGEDVAAPPADAGAIVIKGSSGAASPEKKRDEPTDPERLKKIQALEAEARASQGQDNGQPLRAKALPRADVIVAARIWREKVLAKLAEVNAGLREVAKARAGPEGETRALERKEDDLRDEKRELEKELAEIPPDPGE